MPLKVNTSGTAIKNVAANSMTVPANKIISNGVVTWERLEATFNGLTLATPSAYGKQIVISGEDSTIDPTTPYSGAMYFDTNLEKLFIHTTSWDAGTVLAVADPGGTPVNGDRWFDITNSLLFTYINDDRWDLGKLVPTGTDADPADVWVNPIKEGYTFNNWLPAFSIITADQIYTAQWLIDTYTIAYNENGGTTVSDIVEDYAIDLTGYTLPVQTADIDRFGYTLNGWFNDDTTFLSAFTIPATMPDYNGIIEGDATEDVYAKWSPNTYELIYNKNTIDINGNVLIGTPEGTIPLQEIVFDTSEEITASLYTAPTGYAVQTIEEWDTASDGSGTDYGISASFTMNVLGDTLYQQWDPNSYNVVFNKNIIDLNGNDILDIIGGSTANQAIDYGDTEALTTNGYTATHYTYVDWDTASDGTGTNYANTANFYMNILGDTLYAQWDPTSYDVTYNNNSVYGWDTNENNLLGTLPTAPANQSIDFGDIENLTTPGVLAGYDMSWNTLTTTLGNQYASNAPFLMDVAGDILYQQYNPKPYNVVFNRNTLDKFNRTLIGTPPTVPANQSIDYGNTLNLSTYSNLPYTGYAFDGWNINADGTGNSGTDYADNAAFYMDLFGDILYAQWSPATYDVAYNYNTIDGNGNTLVGTPIGTMANSSILYGDTQNLRANTFVLSPYTFNGWNINADGTGNSGSNYANSAPFLMDVTGDILYAQWTAPAPYTVTLDANGGIDGTASVSATYGAAMSSGKVAPTKTGYLFDGYYDTDDGNTASGTQYYSNTMVSTHVWDFLVDTTLYAKWTLNGSIITFDKEGGSGGADGTTAYLNTAMPAGLMPPTKTGNIFDGYWDGNNGTGTQYYTAVNSTTAMTSTTNWDKTFATDILYAKWIVEYHDILFVENGGTTVTDISDVNYGTEIILPSSVRPGYDSNGWYDANTTTTYNGNNGTGNHITWSTMPDLNGTTEANNGSDTLYAKWTPIEYTIAFDNNSGVFTGASGTMSSMTSRIYDYPYNLTSYNTTDGTLITSPAGWKFDGWATSSGGAVVYSNGENISNLRTTAGITTLYAHYAKESHTINYNLEGELGCTSLTRDYGTDISALMCTPTRKGYIFGGWYNEVGLTTSFSWPPTMPNYSANEIDTNTTTGEQIYAKWVVESHSIIFNEEGGTAVSDFLDVDYGTVITMPDGGDTTRTGYTFVAWHVAETSTIYHGYNGSGTIKDYDTMPDLTLGDEGSDSIILYAEWTPHAYTVTYKANGGTGSDYTQNFVYNETETLQTEDFADPSQANIYYWNTAANGSGTTVATNYNSSTLASVVDGTIDLYVIWRYFYYYYFEPNGGTDPGDQAFYEGSSLDSLDLLSEKNGYADITSDDGWYSTSNFDTNWTKPATMPSTNVTLYAKWPDRVTNYNITFTMNGGTNTAANIAWGISGYDIEDSLITMTTPSKTDTTGYYGTTFTGWTPSATIPAGSTGNKSFTANWDDGTIEHYYITTDENGGIPGIATLNVNYGTIDFPAMFPIEPTMTKPATAEYIFSNPVWTIDGSAIPSTVPDYGANETVKAASASWTETTNLYDITFNYYSGALAVVREDVPWGTNPTAPTGKTTDDNYYYYTWDIHAVTGTETITEDRHDQLYRVRFFNYAGEVVDTDYVLYTGDASPSGETSNTVQYVYSWGDSAQWTNVTAAVDVYEQRTTLEYDLIFIENGGSTVANLVDVAYETNISATSLTTTKTGYTSITSSDGWWDDSSFTVDWNLPTYMYNPDNWVYAKWAGREKLYDIAFLPNGGTGSQALQGIYYNLLKH